MHNLFPQRFKVQTCCTERFLLFCSSIRETILDDFKNKNTLEVAVWISLFNNLSYLKEDGVVVNIFKNLIPPRF